MRKFWGFFVMRYAVVCRSSVETVGKIPALLALFARTIGSKRLDRLACCPVTMKKEHEKTREQAY